MTSIGSEEYVTPKGLFVLLYMGWKTQRSAKARQALNRIYDLARKKGYCGRDKLHRTMWTNKRDRAKANPLIDELFTFLSGEDVIRCVERGARSRRRLVNARHIPGRRLS